MCVKATCNSAVWVFNTYHHVMCRLCWLTVVWNMMQLKKTLIKVPYYHLSTYRNMISDKLLHLYAIYLNMCTCARKTLSLVPLNLSYMHVRHCTTVLSIRTKYIVDASWLLHREWSHPHCTCPAVDIMEQGRGPSAGHDVPPLAQTVSLSSPIMDFKPVCAHASVYVCKLSVHAHICVSYLPNLFMLP